MILWAPSLGMVLVITCQPSVISHRILKLSCPQSSGSLMAGRQEDTQTDPPFLLAEGICSHTKYVRDKVVLNQAFTWHEFEASYLPNFNRAMSFSSRFVLYFSWTNTSLTEICFLHATTHHWSIKAPLTSWVLLPPFCRASQASQKERLVAAVHPRQTGSGLQ